MALRRSLSTPIPAIFGAAELLLQAVERHLCGDRAGAEACFYQANDEAVWAYTDRAWGKGSAVRYGFLKIGGSPQYLPAAERPRPRMPSGTTRIAAIARDGHHCRFCGIPVVDPALRRLMAVEYPTAISWGPTNRSQHAALQCLWLQFDHILPNSRGGDSSLENIVVACAACNFGRMEATLEEAQLVHPLTLEPPIVWKHHRDWDGLERYRV